MLGHFGILALTFTIICIVTSRREVVMCMYVYVYIYIVVDPQANREVVLQSKMRSMEKKVLLHFTSYVLSEPDCILVILQLPVH